MKDPSGVLLIHPPSLGSPKIFDGLKYPPMGLAFLAAALREKGRPVEVLDANVLGLSIDEVRRRVEEADPAVVGVSFTSMLAEGAYALARSLKERAGKTFLVAGGYHPTVMAEEVFERAPFDALVRGEGETALAELLAARESGFPGGRIPDGVSLRRDGAIITAPPRKELEDLDLLPMPAYDLLPLERYASLASTRKPFVTFIRSRGCPFRCIFCGVQAMFARSFRCQSPDKTLAEVGELVRRFGVREVLFKDSDFLIDKRNVAALCERLKAARLDLIWSANARVDLVDAPILLAMKEAGCRMITYGIESGDQDVLDALKKDITLADIERAARLTREAGIQFTANFIVGNPGETEASVGKSLDLANRLDPDYGNFSYLTAFPGSELYGMARRNGWFLDSEGGSYDYEVLRVNATRMDRGTLERLLSKVYRRFYFRPAYIMKRLKKMSVPELRKNVKGLISITRGLLSR